ncbi:MAG: acyltransferase family protein [Oscillospiraceae bacterium]|jgi:peptidoglycan/LPS O-acetylase OafA/YrhL|nr:acyltransferase family protein [Oscillospiraceae bacterium]
MTETKSQRISSVEFWRFFFTVFVCLYHLEIFFYSQKKALSSGSGAVEFFFILAGFTMAMSSHRKLSRRFEPVSTREAAHAALDFVVKKLKAIYPILIVVLLFGFVLYPLMGVQSAGAIFGAVKPTSILHNLLNSEWEWLIMVGTPFGYNNGASPVVHMWFLTHLLLIGYLYTYAIYKHHDFVMFLAPALGVLGYIFFSLNSGILLDFTVKMGFLSAGSVHAIAEMSLGISMYRLYDYLSKKDLSALWRLLLTAIMAFAIYRIFALTIYTGVSVDNFRKIPYMMIIILLSFLNEDYISRWLNKPFWRGFGHISLAMYLCHVQLVQVYMQGLVFVKTQLVNHLFTSMSAGAWLSFLSNTGGFDAEFRSVPMNWKDMLIFGLLVIFTACIIMAIVSLSKRGIAKLKMYLAAAK